MPIYMKVEGIKGDARSAAPDSFHFVVDEADHGLLLPALPQPNAIIAILIGLLADPDGPSGDQDGVADLNAGGGWDPASLQGLRDLAPEPDGWS